MSRALAPVPTDSALRPVPGDGGPPFVGYSFQAMHDPVRHARARYDRYGPVSWSTLFGQRFVSLLGPEATGTALQNREKAFGNGPGWSYFIGPFFRRGLMLLDFDEHLQHRRIMQQAFTNQRLAAYLDAMNPAIAHGLAGWPSGRAFRVYPGMKQLTLDLATRVFTGGELGAAADRVNDAFAACVRAGTAYVRYPVPGLRWARGLAGRRYLEELLTGQVPGKAAGDGDDLFTGLCHAETPDGHRFTSEDVVNHMIFLMMAAHDTSTITMTTMAYHLARHPEWQRRCREQSRALGPTVGYQDLGRLTDLDLVMKESLRTVTPVPALARRTVADTEVLGHFVPRDTMVNVSLHFTHQMAEYWPEPERFDPERFAPHRREDKIHRHAWAPFGGGAHKCIGMHFGVLQIKAVMHQLLLRYRWSVPPGYRMRIDFTSLPRPKDGLPVSLEQL